METMNVTFGEQESRRVKVTGSTSVIRVEGTVTINRVKKVEQADGMFYKVSDDTSVGNFSRYGEINANLNNVPDDVLEDCARAVKLFISGIETQEAANN